MIYENSSFGVIFSIFIDNFCLFFKCNFFQRFGYQTKILKLIFPRVYYEGVVPDAKDLSSKGIRIYTKTDFLKLFPNPD